METTIYSKYLEKLRTAVYNIQMMAVAAGQGPYVQTKEELDARIKALDAVIKWSQDAKRGLIYFRNRME